MPGVYALLWLTVRMHWILYHFVRLIAKNWYEKCEITIENKHLNQKQPKMYNNNNVECELAIKSSGVWGCLLLEMWKREFIKSGAGVTCKPPTIVGGYHR